MRRKQRKQNLNIIIKAIALIQSITSVNLVANNRNWKLACNLFIIKKSKLGSTNIGKTLKSNMIGYNDIQEAAEKLHKIQVPHT